VYAELAASRPDLIHILSKPDWPFKKQVTQLTLHQPDLIDESI
jgi:hypothetical protein